MQGKQAILLRKSLTKKMNETVLCWKDLQLFIGNYLCFDKFMHNPDTNNWYQKHLLFLLDMENTGQTGSFKIEYQCDLYKKNFLLPCAIHHL